ncbi:hypothetical protein MMC20_006830 [Loxospora ochrophaea]|nr:hypothetical protein [Loxospora ochrophaea]
MNASLEWDPQFSAHVPLWISNLTGQTVRYLNPFNFTNVTVGNISVAGAPPALYAFSNAVQCVYPLSGVYYFLNRLLFYQEVFFGLSALALGYEWLSTIIIAAALNYSASAAVHAFTLCLNPSYRHSETDYIVVFYILSLSILLANPLLQWSRTIRRKDRVDIRLVVSLWAAFVWVGAMVDIPFPLMLSAHSLLFNSHPAVAFRKRSLFNFWVTGLLAMMLYPCGGMTLSM